MCRGRTQCGHMFFSKHGVFYLACIKDIFQPFYKYEGGENLVREI